MAPFMKQKAPGAIGSKSHPISDPSTLRLTAALQPENFIA
jgi:hypothetical protein